MDGCLGCRRAHCTRQRMQLVVMAAVLALAGADPRCSPGCHPNNVTIAVESCGMKEQVYTTICEGQCHHQEINYDYHEEDTPQSICNGDWFYEVKYIAGCPVGATYPVARNCKCTRCNEEDTYCGHFPEDILSCSFPLF
ncbi:gonadotropin subunit beta-1-like [Parambassis ranga]|uniref:Gonadotropin subunit beta-1-like n=1 Tax=Parambassis ranga TaxID=210632 RepID=A0A6P7ICG7_9TELE|nr:gonadotropin subunit beta-1-like [Parambassis ranga]